jgi:DtxR family transcriptional regulator, Mn-dependent transcriptional regulator
MLSTTEENYLKAIYTLSERMDSNIGTNHISSSMNTSAASVTDMLKRLSEKGLVHYEKYKGVILSENGGAVARNLVRKHRLWEVFLSEKLHFPWEKVHEIAEQLEHIQSEELESRLDEFLGFPKVDPHGDPIPDAQGRIFIPEYVILSSLSEGSKAKVMGVKEDSLSFLQYLNSISIAIGTNLEVLKIFPFDGSMSFMNGNTEIFMSEKVASALLVKPEKS